jgi:hypothetical protein
MAGIYAGLATLVVTHEKAVHPGSAFGRRTSPACDEPFFDLCVADYYFAVVPES